MDEYDVKRKMVRPNIEKQKKYNKNYKRKGKMPRRAMVYLLALGLFTQGGRMMEQSIQKHLEDNRSAVTTEINVHADADLAVYEAALQTIRNLNLEDSIDLKNTYKTNHNGYELDNYYLYQMALGNKEDFDNYSKLAFALPILNNKDIDKDSAIYQKAQDILESSSNFLMRLAEEISIDKLTDGLNKVSVDDLSPEKLEQYKELKEMAESGNIKMERIPIDKTYHDYIFYEKPDKEKAYGIKRQNIAEIGRKSGRTPILESKENERLLDGFNSIADSVKVRGEILLGGQMYESALNRTEDYDEREKSRQSYLDTILKAANTLPVLDNREIDEIDFQKGKVIEHDPEKDEQEKNFKNLIENDLTKSLAVVSLKERTNEDKEQEKDEKEKIELLFNNQDQDQDEQDLENEDTKNEEKDIDDRDY